MITLLLAFNTAANTRARWLWRISCRRLRGTTSGRRG